MSLFVLLGVYVQAITYAPMQHLRVLLDGKLLTYLLIGAMCIAVCAVVFRISLAGVVPGGAPILFVNLFALNGLFSIVGMALSFGVVDVLQFVTGFHLLVLPALFGVVSYCAVTSVERGKRLVGIICFLNLAIAFGGLVSYFLGDAWLSLLRAMSSTARLPLHYGGVLRMTSVIWNPLWFGVLMALTSLLALSVFLWTRAHRSLWFAAFAISAVCTVLSFTRTAWIMLAVGVATALILARRELTRRATVVFGLGFMALVLAVVPLPRGNYSDVIDAVIGHVAAVSSESETKRGENLAVGAARIAENPIGYGLGAAGYAALSIREVDSPAVFLTHVSADNSYMSMVLQVGVQGLLLFLLAQAVAFRRVIGGIRAARSVWERSTLTACAVWIVAMLCGGMFLNVWEYGFIPYVVFGLWGVSLKMSTLQRRRMSEESYERGVTSQ